MINSVQFSLSVLSDSETPRTAPRQASLSIANCRGDYSNSCPWSRSFHPTISSSVVPFSFRLQSFPASGSFLINRLFTPGGQSIGASVSASVLPTNIPIVAIYVYILVSILGRRHWRPTPVLLPGKSHGRRSLVGCSPWGHEESDMTEQLHFHFHFSLFTFMHWRRKWQPTPVFLPGESQGRGSLAGCRLWGPTESDTTEVT